MIGEYHSGAEDAEFLARRARRGDVSTRSLIRDKTTGVNCPFCVPESHHIFGQTVVRAGGISILERAP